MTENDLLAAVLDLAKLYGWRTLHIRPARTEKGWRSPIQGDGKGFPDLLLLKGLDFLVVELKSERGHTTKEQDVWLDAFENFATLVVVWTPRDWANGIILAELKGASLDQENRTP